MQVKFLISALILGVLSPVVLCQEPGENGQKGRNFVVLKPGDAIAERVRKAANVAPSTRQLKWQEREFIAFTHFGMDTFTDREWGEGTESVSLFNPAAFNAGQWVKVLKAAGMKMLIITAKHHDGFCLWPSKYTEHSVKNSPWRQGKGDVVREVADACREYGLKFGIYLSPWDRHEPTYGNSPLYNEHFKNQLRELLTTYGQVSEVWFDGACGEGPNGKKQVYDWQSYYALARELQPEAVIAVMGPDVRWVGTESGYGRETEWSVVPDVLQNLDSIAYGSQQHPVEGAFVPGDLTGEDLGSRERIKSALTLLWYPSEVDVSIRPGWFYHESEDSRVKSPEKLVDIYYSSVGRNSVLLLNVPPDKSGQIHESDVKSLTGMRKILDQTFRKNLAQGSKVSVSSESERHQGSYILDDDPGTYWSTDEGVDSGRIVVEFPRQETFDRLMLQEYIGIGQRIENFSAEAWEGGKWVEFCGGTTVGYKRLLRFPVITTGKLRLIISRSRQSPTLSSLGVFKAPPEVLIEPEGGAFVDSMKVSLSSDSKNALIRYTLDTIPPGEKAQLYSGPVTIKKSSLLAAVCFAPDGVESLVKSAEFTKALKGIRLRTPFSSNYSGGGMLALVDGIHGSRDFRDGHWQGYERDDLDAIIDLGGQADIKHISANFFQDVTSWIFLPRWVEYAVSADGDKFEVISLLKNEIPDEQTGAVIKSFDAAFEKIKARFIRVRAKNIGACPPWHQGAGGKAWLFADEITVE